MNYNLFLDDIRNPVGKDLYYLDQDEIKFYETNNWIVIRNYDNFVNHIIKYGLPKIVSFDVDLQEIHYKIGRKNGFSVFNIEDYEKEGINKTGVHCTQFIIDYCKDNDHKLPTPYIHSQNPAGSQEIRVRLNNFIKRSIKPTHQNVGGMQA
jgi:hypothetical protein